MDVRGTETGMEVLGRWKMVAIGDCRIQGWIIIPRHDPGKQRRTDIVLSEFRSRESKWKVTEVIKDKISKVELERKIGLRIQGPKTQTFFWCSWVPSVSKSSFLHPCRLIILVQICFHLYFPTFLFYNHGIFNLSYYFGNWVQESSNLNQLSLWNRKN